jgi:hypothetical protein
MSSGKTNVVLLNTSNHKNEIPALSRHFRKERADDSKNPMVCLVDPNIPSDRPCRRFAALKSRHSMPVVFE